ncbi:MAG: hypothetical protein LBU20_01995 [Candidatus Nomurabacteria bacterium]|jgi:hypothetical protein|nr:hypothetical protein [Candidatus Nomurabacteria bacterium]
MTKISKLILGAGALGVLGITALPLASYAVVDTELTITVNQQDDVGGGTGGNNAKGYTWKVKDKDGTKLNMSLDTDGAGSSSSVSTIAPAATSAAYTTAGTTAVYGVKFTPTAVTGGPTVTGVSANYIAITGADQTIGATGTAGNIESWPTGLSINSPSGTYYGIDTAGSSPVSITAQWNTNLGVGVYKNTITISQTSNT